MPKLKQTAQEKLVENIVVNIDAEATRKNATAEELAKAAGLAVSTYYQYRNDPLKFRVEHIFGLARYFRMKPEELLIDRRRAEAK